MLIKLLSRGLLHLFFSGYQVHRPERVPTSGPLLIVSNHHSSLMDPVVLLATLQRQPRFLAKAVLWSPRYLPLRPFLRLAGAIPVHRRSDGGGDNSGMFAACHRALQRGEAIALFAEGASHDLPGLLDLKTGAARIALGTGIDLPILPVGLIYDDRSRYRSKLSVYVGEPLPVEADVGADSDQQQVRDLTARIEEGLDAVAPTWESWREHDDARIAARVLTGSSASVALGEAMTALNRAVDEHTEEGVATLDRVTALRQEADRLGLDIETVVNQPRASLRRLNTRSSILSVFWAVPAIAGRFINLPPFLLIGQIAKSQKLNFQATFKLLLGLALYPAYWCAMAMIIGWLIGPVFGIMSLIALPLLGYVAARKTGSLRRARNRETLRDRGDLSALERRRDEVAEAASQVLAVHKRPDSGGL